MGLIEEAKKIKEIHPDYNIAMCGFPLRSSFKVRTKIEEKEINYMIIEPRNNYDVEVKEDFGNLNEYDKQFKKAYSQNKRKKKTSHISEALTLLIENPNFKEII